MIQRCIVAKKKDQINPREKKKSPCENNFEKLLESDRRFFGKLVFLDFHAFVLDSVSTSSDTEAAEQRRVENVVVVRHLCAKSLFWQEENSSDVNEQS